MSKSEKEMLKQKIFLFCLPYVVGGFGALLMYYLIVFKL